jgi:hypothetical protein
MQELSNCQLRDPLQSVLGMSVDADEGGHLLGPKVAEKHEDE